MAVRATWKGDLKVGELVIPAGFANMVEDKEVRFSQFTRDGNPVGRQAYDKETGEFLFKDEIVRGRKVGDVVVIVSDGELEALSPEKSNAVEIVEFVSRWSVDPVYLTAHYAVVPDEGRSGTYDGLVSQMIESGVVGVGSTVRRGRETLVVLRVVDGVLVVSFMRSADEIRPMKEFASDGPAAVSDDVMSTVAETVSGMVSEWEPGKYQDLYRVKVDALIQAKAATVLSLTEKGLEGAVSPSDVRGVVVD